MVCKSLHGLYFKNLMCFYTVIRMSYNTWDFFCWRNDRSDFIPSSKCKDKSLIFPIRNRLIRREICSCGCILETISFVRIWTYCLAEFDQNNLIFDTGLELTSWILTTDDTPISLRADEDDAPYELLIFLFRIKLFRSIKKLS